jgi:hypothetical protein
MSNRMDLNIHFKSGSAAGRWNRPGKLCRIIWSNPIPSAEKLRLLIYGRTYRLTDEFPFSLSVAGLAASISGIVLVMRIHEPRKPLFYFSIAFAAFLFLVGISELATNIEYTRFTEVAELLIFITSIMAAVLLWRDL